MAMLPSGMAGGAPNRALPGAIGGSYRSTLDPVAPQAPTSAPQQQPQQPQQQQQPGVNPAYVQAPPQSPTAQAAAPQQVNPQNIMQLAGGQLGYNAAQSNVNLDPSSFAHSIWQGLSPQFAMQDHGLTEQLANAGIVGGSSAGAATQLGLQQQAQFQGDLQPILANLKGYELSQSQGNQMAQNTASQFGAGQNLSAAEQQAQQYLAAMQGNQTAGLNQGEFNANQQNANSQFNVSNAIKNAQGNSDIYNQFLSNIMGFNNQDWLAQLQAQTALNSGSMSGQTNAYQPTFMQPGPAPSLSGLGAFAPAPTASGSYGQFVTPGQSTAPSSTNGYGSFNGGG